MKIEQLNLQAISIDEMSLINGGDQSIIDPSSTAYQIGDTVGQALKYAVKVYGIYAIFFL